MVVLNAESLNYSKKAKEIWRDHNYRYVELSWSEIDQVSTLEDVEILITRLNRNVDREVLDKFPKIKMVVSATTGHDHLDLPELYRRNIEVISLRPHKEFLETIPSTAEHTIALIFCLLRNLPGAIEDVRKGFWRRDVFKGRQMKGRQVGIVGLGRIGKRVAEYCVAFGMSVGYFDPFVTDNNYTRFESLENLLSNSEIITFHVHLVSETIHLLNKENIEHLKKGSILINTARGGLWDEAAIVESFEKGKISGIAVDVLESELDDIKKSKIWQLQMLHDNIVITPHIGGATFDAMWDCEEYLAKFICMKRQ